MLRRLGCVVAPATRSLGARLSRRGFSSMYCGDVGDVLRFECVHPAATTLAPLAFRGHVVLVVNTASQAAEAATQLPALQQLHATYNARGLDIVAVPSNDFEKKEPAGSDAELATVYGSPDGAFKVGFPVAKKAAVVGANAHEFFVRVAKKYGRSVAPTWNFDKFLVDAYGDLSAVFPHDTDPLEPQVIEAIEDALAEIPSEQDLAAAADDDDLDDDDEYYDSEEEEEDNDDDDSDEDDDKDHDRSHSKRQ